MATKCPVNPEALLRALSQHISDLQATLISKCLISWRGQIIVFMQHMTGFFPMVTDNGMLEVKYMYVQWSAFVDGISHPVHIYKGVEPIFHTPCCQGPGVFIAAITKLL